MYVWNWICVSMFMPKFLFHVLMFLFLIRIEETCWGDCNKTCSGKDRGGTKERYWMKAKCLRQTLLMAVSDYLLTFMYAKPTALFFSCQLQHVCAEPKTFLVLSLSGRSVCVLLCHSAVVWWSYVHECFLLMLMQSC